MNFKERVNPTTTTKALIRALPYITISKEALTKMFHYIDQCAEEVGWLGTAYERDEKEIYIEDVYLFDQEVHATTTEITPEGLSTFAEEILTLPDGVEIWNNLKMWGHSHVNMGITPSAQDDKQMETFQEGGHDWFIRLIANKKGELKIDLYSYENGIVYIDLPWETEETEAERVLNERIRALYQQLDAVRAEFVDTHKEHIIEEMKVKVRKKSLTTPYYNKPIQALQKTNGGVITDTNEKKNTTSIANTNVRESIREGNFDFFTTDDEVPDEFSFEELYEFSECQTLTEVEELCESFGWYNMTDSDLERIMRVSIKKMNYIFKVKGREE